MTGKRRSTRVQEKGERLRGDRDEGEGRGERKGKGKGMRGEGRGKIKQTIRCARV